MINEDYYYIGLCDSGNSVTHYTWCNYHDSDSYILAKTAIMTVDMWIQVCVCDIVLPQHTHKHVKKMQRWRGIFLVKLIAAGFVLEGSKRSISIKSYIAIIYSAILYTINV